MCPNNVRAQAERCKTLMAPTARKFLKKHFPNDFKPPSHAPHRGTAPQTANRGLFPSHFYLATNVEVCVPLWP